MDTISDQRPKINNHLIYHIKSDVYQLHNIQTVVTHQALHSARCWPPKRGFANRKCCPNLNVSLIMILQNIFRRSHSSVKSCFISIGCARYLQTARLMTNTRNTHADRNQSILHDTWHCRWFVANGERAVSDTVNDSDTPECTLWMDMWTWIVTGVVIKAFLSFTSDAHKVIVLDIRFERLVWIVQLSDLSSTLNVPGCINLGCDKSDITFREIVRCTRNHVTIVGESEPSILCTNIRWNWGIRDFIRIWWEVYVDGYTCFNGIWLVRL